MTQVAMIVRPLKNRLNPFYWDDITDPRLPLQRITSSAGYARRFPGIDVVRSLVVHETAGWPSRNKVETWVSAYSRGTSTVGPQVGIWADGTVTPLVNYPDQTGHATFVNSWALGVETGHRDVRTGYTLGVVAFNWLPLSPDANDLTGQKYFAIKQRADNPTEIVPAWFPTSTYFGPKRDAGVPDGMLFTESQYRSWALLMRYLAEAFKLPRNFPLLPHALRGSTITGAATFRRIVMADEKIDDIRATLVRELVTTAGANTFVDADFNSGQEVNFDTHYADNVTPANRTIPGWGFVANAMMNDGHPGGATRPKLQKRNVRLNKAWLWFFKVYRGIHGHGFSGNIHQGSTRWNAATNSYVDAASHDHDCPGPQFDWHRFAREVWDWWWYPFDFDAAHTRTDVPIRDYRVASGTTPLREYFFHKTVAQVEGRLSPLGGIHGATSSPSTFQLEANSPVYAPANGEIVAARFPRTAAGTVDMGFVLVRHDAYHMLDSSALAAILAQLAGMAPPPVQPPRADRLQL